MSAESVELSAQECTTLIAGGGIGRVVFCNERGPQIYPVSFIVHGDDIIFRTSSYTTLGTSMHGQPVAFEVDELDLERRLGWSVIVTGVAQALDDPDDVARLSHCEGLEPWAGGARRLYVRIAPRGITGRRVGHDR